MSKLKSLLLTQFDLSVDKKNIQNLAAQYFDESYKDLVHSCDKVFVGLMIFQWFFSMAIALWYSPLTYIGLQSQIHYHVWLAALGGGLLAAVPVVLYFLQPGHVMNRYVNVISQGLFSALLIHLMGGRLETHFHVFGSLAFFAFYRDLKVLAVGTLVVAGDHLIRGIWFPQSVFGLADVSQWRWLEHAAWVVFEDFFLSYACIKSLYEMKIVALKRAETEDQKNTVEEIVTVRTAELSQEKDSMKTVLDTIDQGLFVINRSAVVIGEPSQRSYQLFSSNEIKGKKFSTLLNQAESEYDSLIELLFSGDMHHDSCIELFPQKIQLGEKTMLLSYKPVFRDEKIESLLVAASDISQLEKVQQESRTAEGRNRAVVKILSAKNEFVEAVQMVDQLSLLATNYDSFKRQLHTLKGSFAFLECGSIAEFCHEVESSLPKDENEFRKFSQKLANAIKEKVQKFIDDNNQVLKINSESQLIEIELPKVKDVIHKIKQNESQRSALEEIDELLKVNIQDELSWLSDAFKQACEKMDKECLPIRFVSNTRIPMQTYKSLFKSFIHIVRNTADHGLEDPAERQMLDKNGAGQLQIELKENPTHYTLIFKDDGRGVDIESLRKKLGPQADKFSDDQVLDSIFKSGFTTKTTISETSGRGVGLDAVRYEAEKLNGKCWAVNFPGESLEIHIQFKKVKFSDLYEYGNHILVA